ncbi:MAG: esterase/lipase family protein, partial [Thermoplasmatota archaeon]
DNLTGDRDYTGCTGMHSITVRPETPGMYPVVLIHGWFGSMTHKLIQTWSNITEKLQRHGFTILDFDTTRPGIQYLRYKPGWADHHISWMAGKVNDAIKEALVENGYSPNQTIDIVTHSMGGLVARFLAEQVDADVDKWNNSWQPGDQGTPWYGDGDPDISIGGRQIDDLFMVGTMNHGTPPNLNETFLKRLDYIPLPWWTCQMQDMVYQSKFLEALGYQGCDIVDYYAIGSDIGFRIGEPKDFDGDGVAHTTDGLVPTESPYLEGAPLYIVTGEARPNGDADHNSQIAINDEIHQYIIRHLA